MRIINLTQHQATTSQRDEGVLDLPANIRQELLALITFDAMPNRAQMERRAASVAEIAANALGVIEGAWTDIPEAAMIGGAPYFQSVLEEALLTRSIEPVYAFSRRESIDQVQPDGSVRKVQEFRHLGVVRPFEQSYVAVRNTHIARLKERIAAKEKPSPV